MDNILSYNEIILPGRDDPIIADPHSLTWGRDVINKMSLDCLNDTEKACKIREYVSDHFRYTFTRRLSLQEIISKKSGNCVSHSLIGLFLLRLAGIPAKFAHEVHLTQQYRLISLVVGRWAKKNNDGINSYWHNDHVWVWFRHNEKWEPFDSALGVCGLSEFYNKRFFKHRELSKGFAQRWTGPPFVIWEVTSKRSTKMKNVTSNILNDDSLKKLSQKNEWLDFVNLFDNWTVEDFHKAYLSELVIQKIKRMSIQWFKKS